MPSRIIHCAEGVAWLKSQTFDEQHAIITSLPDVSEMQRPFESWRHWFIETAQLICSAVSPRAMAIFFQTDIKREGRWVDKGYLVQKGAELAGSFQLFHKVVCRAPAGHISFGRPAFAHLLGFSRELRFEPAAATPDVLPTLGEMPWARAMGVNACETAVDIARRIGEARVVVDPFCGFGTVLAIANQHGLDAIGVELSAKRAERARQLQLKPGRHR
jgi:hypothetical protein